MGRGAKRAQLFAVCFHKTFHKAVKPQLSRKLVRGKTYPSAPGFQVALEAQRRWGILQLVWIRCENSGYAIFRYVRFYSIYVVLYVSSNNPAIEGDVLIFCVVIDQKNFYHALFSLKTIQITCFQGVCLFLFQFSFVLIKTVMLKNRVLLCRNKLYSTTFN